MLTGMSVRTVSAKVVANPGWDKVRATAPVRVVDSVVAFLASRAPGGHRVSGLRDDHASEGAGDREGHPPSWFVEHAQPSYPERPQD
jgi:hypothetical protein